ncbi:hypothetical protein AOLI_G00067900 [Acnodon oligacanthus]
MRLEKLEKCRTLSLTGPGRSTSSPSGGRECRSPGASPYTDSHMENVFIFWFLQGSDKAEGAIPPCRSDVKCYERFGPMTQACAAQNSD